MTITHIEIVPVIGDFDLTPAERDYFGWIDSSETLTWDDADFFRYRGSAYCLSDFEATSVPDWDGQHTDSFFSAVLIKYMPDDNAVRVALYLAD